MSMRALVAVACTVGVDAVRIVLTCTAEHGGRGSETSSTASCAVEKRLGLSHRSAEMRTSCADPTPWRAISQITTTRRGIRAGIGGILPGCLLIGLARPLLHLHRVMVPQEQ